MYSCLYLDVDECEAQPCLNNGTCSTPELAIFRCACEPGFSGDRCELGKFLISIENRDCSKEVGRYRTRDEL